MRAVRVLALGAAMMIGTGGVALAQQTDSSAPPRAEQEREGKGRRADGARGKRGRGERGIARALFRDIELSAEQRTRIEQINERYRGEHQQLRERLRASRDSTARLDSAQRAAFRAQAQQVMRRRLAEIRGVLSARQQGTFDRNVREIEQRMADRRERGDRGRRGRGPGARPAPATGGR